MSRRRAIISLLIFTVLCIVAELVFDVLPIRTKLMRAERYTKLADEFEHYTTCEPDIVFIGDSRVIHSIAPDTIDLTVRQLTGKEVCSFNLGLPGAPPIAHFAWVDHLLTREKMPRLVVIFISPYMFSTGIQKVLSREALPSLYTAAGAWKALSFGGLTFEETLYASLSDMSDLVRYRRTILGMIWKDAAVKGPADTGSRGWIKQERGLFYPEQQAHARQRADGYRKETTVPPHAFNEEQFLFLEHTIRSLRAHGADVMVVTTPESAVLRKLNKEKTVYPDYIRRVRQLSRKLGISLFDHQAVPVISDHYFSDGDHMTQRGAERYSVYLAHQVLGPYFGGPAPEKFDGWEHSAPSAGCEVVYDFENFVDLRVRFTGDAFPAGFVSGQVGSQLPVSGYRGMQLLNSFSPVNGDDALGEVLLAGFAATKPLLSFSVGGGKNAAVGVEVSCGGQVVGVARGSDSETLTPAVMDVSVCRGRMLDIRLFDRAKGPWGHLMLDQVELCDNTP